MRIGIDIMGGDFAPRSSLLGASLAEKELSEDVELVLIGDEQQINAMVDENNLRFSKSTIFHTPEVIGMGEHPSRAFNEKENSSIVQGFRLLKSGEIDGLASAGNTGAMLVGAMFVVKSISGIIRPSIAAPIPGPNGNFSLLLDVGLNPDAKPDVLYQYAILGSIYAESVYNIENPRVGLLNIGSEEEKGNMVTKTAYQHMSGSREFNFIGNVEGTDFFSNEKADVIVCDGFTGNVVLKEAEAFYKLIKNRNIQDEYFERFNFENYGGTPILGINSCVVIGHGISNPIATKNMILHTKEIIEAQLCEKFKKAIT